MRRVGWAGLVSLSLLGATLPLASAVQAQDWPQRPVRVIAASSAGGLSDIFIRVLGERLHKRWGQPLVVENRPGGAFNIAPRACADAAPDGYTICILPADVMQYNRHVFQSLSYDMYKDIEPITLLFHITQGLVVSSKLGVSTLDGLAAYAKANPKTLSYAAPAIPHQIFIENFKAESGADIVRVPFRGGGEAVNQLLGGTTPVAFFGIGNFAAHLRSGALKGLAVDAHTRSPLFPDIPTLREVRPNVRVTRADFSLWAPAGFPAAILKKIRDDVAEVAADKEFVEKNVIQRGLDPVFNTADEFKAYLAAQRVEAEEAAKAAKLEKR
jgi:tripartite-type tricarboxylate transporter receptor subunit TctC